jgi:hypothetical protein
VRPNFFQYLIILIIFGLSYLACREQSNNTINVLHLKSLRSTDTTKAKLLNLKKEEAFWSNRLRLAEDKSIDLIIDMVQQEIILEVKGVPLRHARYAQSRGDIRQRTQELLQWSSQNFLLIRDEASIPKEPIHIRRLPEETSKLEEGYDFNFVDDVPTVFVRLNFDPDLELEFLESGKSIPDSLAKFERRKNWLQFTMNRSDIIAVYRALPENTIMLLRLDTIKQ